MQSRKHVLNEIIQTEESYLKSLRQLMECYIEPLENKSSIFGKILEIVGFEMVKADLQVIINVNNEFLGSMKKYILEEKSNCKPTETLGQIFLKFAPFLKTYSSYCNRYDSVSTILFDHYQKNKKFAKFLGELQQNPKADYVFFFDLLIIPVQRIPRYNLLLTELLKYTSRYHRDHEHLTNALLIIKDICGYVNSKLKEYEDMIRVVELKQKFGDQLPQEMILAGTKLVADFDQVYYFDPSHRITINDCRFIILDHLIIISSSNYKNLYAVISLSLDSIIHLNSDVSDNNFESRNSSTSTIKKSNSSQMPKNTPGRHSVNSQTQISRSISQPALSSSNMKKSMGVLLPWFLLFKQSSMIYPYISQDLKLEEDKSVYFFQFIHEGTEEKIFTFFVHNEERRDGIIKSVSEVLESLQKTFTKSQIKYCKYMFQNNVNQSEKDTNNSSSISSIFSTIFSKSSQQFPILSEEELNEFKKKDPLSKFKDDGNDSESKLVKFYSAIRSGNSSIECKNEPNRSFPYKEGDVFVLLANIQKKWVVLKRVGLSINLSREKDLRLEPILNLINYEKLSEMHKSKRKSIIYPSNQKRTPDTSKQLMKFAINLDLIETEIKNSELQDLVIDVDEFLDSQDNCNLSNQSSKQGIKVLNMLNEKDELLILDKSHIQEISDNHLNVKLLKVLRKRDMIEEKKIRNFHIQKPKVNSLKKYLHQTGTIDTPSSNSSPGGTPPLVSQSSLPPSSNRAKSFKSFFEMKN